MAGMLLLLAASATPAAAPPELEPYAFLIGEWVSSGSGQPGAGTGTAVFSRSLQDRVIVRTSFADYPAGNSQGGSRHDDLMIVYVDPGGVRADYYDSEGHVIRYSVESPGPGQAVFRSDESEGQPTFRLSYKLDSGGGLDGQFEIAPPGNAAEFHPYLSWHSAKAQEPAR